MNDTVDMTISRRGLLRKIGAGAAVAVAGPSFAEASLGARVLARAKVSDAAKPEGPIRLDRNETAFGPSKRAIAAMQEAAMNGVSRYPDAGLQAVQTEIANFHGVEPNRVVVGAGSTQILRMAIDTLVGSGGTLISATPTFELIGRYAPERGAEVVAIPLTRNHAHDLDAMAARSNAATGLVYICNPNNPTGTLT